MYVCKLIDIDLAGYLPPWKVWELRETIKGNSALFLVFEFLLWRCIHVLIMKSKTSNIFFFWKSTFKNKVPRKQWESCCWLYHLESREFAEEMTSELNLKGGIAWSKETCCRHGLTKWCIWGMMRTYTNRLGGERKGGMGIRSGCKDGFRVHRKGYKYHTERVELGVDKSFSHLREMITKEVSQKKHPHALQG